MLTRAATGHDAELEEEHWAVAVYLAVRFGEQRLGAWAHLEAVIDVIIDLEEETAVNYYRAITTIKQTMHYQ